MSREVIEVKWCDNHSSQTVRATTETIVMFGKSGSPRLIDLCNECEAAIVEPLKALVQRWGLNPETLTRRGKPQPIASSSSSTVPHDSSQPPLFITTTSDGLDCPMCQKVLTTRQGFVGHCETHGVPSKEKPSACPDCGSKFDTPTACGVHRVSEHGYDVVAEARAALIKMMSDGTARPQVRSVTAA